jgi:hypothetical protein
LLANGRVCGLALSKPLMSKEIALAQPLPPPPRRPSSLSGEGAKLSSADFRFVSAWVQGVDVQDAWQRFEAHRGLGDVRRIRTTVRSILDQLSAIAIRHGDPQAAALLRRDPARIKALSDAARKPAPAASMPTLAQFAAELPHADFYREAELVALLEERYGKAASLRPAGVGGTSTAGRRDTPELRAAKRKGRLVLRQLEALRRLESLAASRPVPEDRTTAWLDPNTCRHLRAVGVLTLGELLFFVRLKGYRWYRKVPRIGEGGAGRLVRWLRAHEETLGAVAIAALAPVTKLGAWLKEPAPAMGVVPIERLRVPSTLSGEGAHPRSLRALLGARSQRLPGGAGVAGTPPAERGDRQRPYLPRVPQGGRALLALGRL